MRSPAIIAALGMILCAQPVIAAAPARSASAKNPVATAALSGRVLTKRELWKIYSDRTWHWKNGAAYFKPSQLFQAWSQNGADVSYAVGSWSVSNNGQLCIRATWHFVSGRKNIFTCYVHRIKKAIYQRELPRGSWYLFGHTPPRPGDEMSKLERGDHIASEYLKIKQYVIRSARTAPKQGTR